MLALDFFFFINGDVNMERFMWKEKGLLGKSVLGK